MNILNLGYGERSSCLAWGCHIRSRALAKEAVVFVFELLGRWVSQLALQFVFGAVGSLVGGLSGLCPIHQIDSSVCVWSCVGRLVRTLSGLCPVRQHVFAAPQFVKDFCVL